VVIRLRGVTKRYGHLQALRGVDLELGAGELLSLFGPNGAGKTTLLRILSTLVPPTSGEVEIAGRPLRENVQELRRRIGVISHVSYLYGQLTALENIRLYARLYGVPQVEERAREVIAEVGLESRQDDLVRHFSRGMQQRLSIARALVHDPQIVLLDEPYTGLDQHAAHVLSRILRKLRDGERTVLLVTHNLGRGLELADRVAILRAGRVVFQSPASAVSREGFEELYFKYVGRESFCH